MKTQSENPAGSLYAIDLGQSPELEAAQSDEIASLPQTFNELPCYYRWAPALKIGEKYSVTRDGKTVEVDASKKNVNQIESDFKKLQTNGVDSPYVNGHIMTGKPLVKPIGDLTLGYAKGTRQKDGWLQVLLQILGDAALDTARKNKVSISLRPNMTDSQGNVYPLAIHHIAATPIPVVPNQSGLLAASRGVEDHEPELITLSAALEPTRSTDMALKPETRQMALKCLDMGDDGMDDDALMSKLAEAHGVLKKKHADEKEAAKRDIVKMREWGANLSREAESVAAELEEANAKIVNLSREDDNPTVDLERLGDRAKLVALRIRSIPGMTPAAAEQWIHLACGNGDELNVISLSREEGSNDSLAERIADTLTATGGFKPGPKTGESGLFVMPRQVDLSNHAEPDADPNFDPKTHELMLSMANGGGAPIGSVAVMTTPKTTK